MSVELTSPVFLIPFPKEKGPLGRLCQGRGGAADPFLVSLPLILASLLSSHLAKFDIILYSEHRKVVAWATWLMCRIILCQG